MHLDISAGLPPLRCNKLALNQITESMFPTSQICLYICFSILIRCESMRERDKEIDEVNEAHEGKKIAEVPADI